MMTPLRQTLLILRREYAAMLAQPLYYVLAGIFFLLTAGVYLVMLTGFARGDESASVNVTDSVVRPTFHALHFFLLVQVPLLTMRLFAEERASGMLDMLQTTPATDWALLAGKFLAGFAALASYVALTALFPLTTAMVSEVEWPVVIGGILALLLASAGYMAMGLFFSALSDSQVVSAVLAYVATFVVAFGQIFADGSKVPVLMDASRHFSVSEHMTALLGGNVAPMNVMYFVVMVALFLFLTARVLEARRWSA